MHKQNIKQKAKTWIARYLPPEIVGTVTAMLGAGLAYMFTQNNVAAAFAGTWGENLGYYGTVLLRDERASRKEHKAKNTPYTISSYLRLIRDVIFEFGPAELLDSFIIRPFMMYIFPVLTGNLALGILLGKIAADIIFYIPAIIMFELRQFTKSRS